MFHSTEWYNVSSYYTSGYPLLKFQFILNPSDRISVLDYPRGISSLIEKWDKEVIQFNVFENPKIVHK